MQSRIEIKIEKEDINQTLEELEKVENIIKVYEGFSIKIGIQIKIEEKTEKSTPKPSKSRVVKSRARSTFPMHDDKSRSVLA